MAFDDMRARMADQPGFIAALDQSGGSTPKALEEYGVSRDAYSDDDEMYDLVHAMRTRIMTAPAFTSDKVLAAILFEDTMDRAMQGQPTPIYLWEKRGVVPFLKVDKGLEAEADGVSLMKPIPNLDALLARAKKLEVFGTKMRSVIKHASPTGVSAIARQQFELAGQIAAHGLLPIVEPEVSIDSPDKAGAETLLRDALLKEVEALPANRQVMLKVTLPEDPHLYTPLIGHPKVLRVVALSGGYARTEACARLRRVPGMIASFSRALLEDLRVSMSDDTFDEALRTAVAEIYSASTQKS